MSCPFSITSSVGFGFYNTTGEFQGFATNLDLSSSDIQVPLFGVGLDSSGALRTGQGHGSGLQVLSENIPSSLGNVYVHIKNLTTGESIGSVTLSSSTSYQNTGASFSSSLNSGDRLVLLIHSDNPGTLPWIMWRFA